MADASKNGDVKRAILDTIAEYEVGADELFPILEVVQKLYEKDYSPWDIQTAVDDMAADGLIANAEIPDMKLTAKGFFEM
jgi:hypothetical protein